MIRKIKSIELLMQKTEPGLAAIGLLVLATILSFLLTAGIPLVLTPEPVKISDWLGFAGSFTGALVTLIAAAIAWRAVQKQIEAQSKIADRQLAIQSFDVLIRQVELLEEERALAGNIELHSRYIVIALETYITENDNRYRWSIERGLDRLKFLRDEIIKLQLQLDSTFTRRWISPSNFRKRHEISRAMLSVDHKLRKFNELLENSLKIEPTSLNISEARNTEILNSVPKSEVDALSACCDEYGELARKSNTRLISHIEKSRRDIGI